MQDNRYSPPHVASSELLADAMRWLQQECRRKPDRSEAATQVLRQLCWSAAVGGLACGGRRSALFERLRLSRELADGADRLFPASGATAARTAPAAPRPELEQLWARYRETRELASPLLDRLLLEAFLYSDLARAPAAGTRVLGALARADREGRRAIFSGGAAVVAAGALLTLADWMLPPALAPFPLAGQGPALLLLGVLGAALASSLRRQWLRRQVLRSTAAAVGKVLREGADTRALSEALRTAILQGLTWSPQTIEVLTRFGARITPARIPR